MFTPSRHNHFNMMCYKDRTWCNAHNCVNKYSCGRYLTTIEEAKAKAWWGEDDPPICFFADVTELECYAPKEKEDRAVE